jgi:hypothetical protein
MELLVRVMKIANSNTNPRFDSAYGAASNWIVYDSLNDQKYIPYTRSLFVRVAELDKGFRGKTASVQVPKQTNYNDCGLFALAFVLAIANKKDPAKLRFNQSTMRDHFSRCIAMDKFTEFDSEYMDIGPVYSEHCFRKMNPIIKK